MYISIVYQQNKVIFLMCCRYEIQSYSSEIILIIGLLHTKTFKCLITIILTRVCTT